MYDAVQAEATAAAARQSHTRTLLSDTEYCRIVPILDTVNMKCLLDMDELRNNVDSVMISFRYC